ncbi:MAG: hypothetical protein P8R54_28080 [Myxococcota bacterium]|nr:hypothetical protein [Myxococcota bacterium]
MRILTRASLLVGAGALLPAMARACLFVVPEPHQLDPSELGIDVTAPDTVDRTTVLISRGRGPVCVDGACASTSCDARGVLSVEFSPASDDRTSSEAMGYRAVLLEGALPDTLTLGENAVLGPDRLNLLWTDGATAEQEPLDFTLGLIAIDLAGNESAPAEVWVADDGRSAAAATGCAAVPRPETPVSLCAVLLLLLRRRRL